MILVALFGHLLRIKHNNNNKKKHLRNPIHTRLRMLSPLRSTQFIQHYKNATKDGIPVQKKKILKDDIRVKLYLFS